MATIHDTAPDVTIALDRLRRLRFDFNAIVEAEKALGLSLLGGFTSQQMSFGFVRAMLWAAMRHEDPALTIDAVGAMLHPGNLGAAIEALTLTWAAATPAAEAEAARPLESSPAAP